MKPIIKTFWQSNPEYLGDIKGNYNKIRIELVKYITNRKNQ